MTRSSAVVDVPLELPATRKFRQCGTPGCSLQDYHFGPCRIVEPSAEDLDADDGELAAAEPEEEPPVVGSRWALPSVAVCDSGWAHPSEPVAVKLCLEYPGRSSAPRGAAPARPLLGHPRATVRRLLEEVSAWVERSRSGHIDWAAVAQAMSAPLPGQPTAPATAMSADDAHRLWRALAYRSRAARPPYAPADDDLAAPGVPAWALAAAGAEDEVAEAVGDEAAAAACSAEAASSAAGGPGAALVGKRIEVYWDGEDAWFEAEVLSYDAKLRYHAVRYVADAQEMDEDLLGQPDAWRHKDPPPAAEKPAAAEKANGKSKAAAAAAAEEGAVAAAVAAAKAAAATEAKAAKEAAVAETAAAEAAAKDAALLAEVDLDALSDIDEYLEAERRAEVPIFGRGEAQVRPLTWPPRATPRIAGRRWPPPTGVAWPVAGEDNVAGAPLELEGVRPPAKKAKKAGGPPWAEEDDQRLWAFLERPHPPSRAELEKLLRRPWEQIRARLGEMHRRRLGFTAAEATAEAEWQHAKEQAAMPKEAKRPGAKGIASRDDELPAAVKADAKLMAVWNAARRLKIEKVDQEEEVHGWRIRYQVRGAGNSEGSGDMYIFPPDDGEDVPSTAKEAKAKAAAKAAKGKGKGPTPPPDAVDSSDEEAAAANGGAGRKRKAAVAAEESAAATLKEETKGKRVGGGWGLGNGAIRSFVVLREVLTARAGPPPSWQPPAVRSWIEVEVTAEDTAQLAAMWRQGDAAVKTEWRLGEVREVAPDGKFRVCVNDAHGVPDEDFVEWYAREEENVEWRRTTRKGK